MNKETKQRLREYMKLIIGSAFNRISEIACYLVVSRSTVQTLIERAEKKIARQVKESIFCNN